MKKILIVLVVALSLIGCSTNMRTYTTQIDNANGIYDSKGWHKENNTHRLTGNKYCPTRKDLGFIFFLVGGYHTCPISGESDCKGYDKEGFNSFGYNSKGYNKNGYNNKGYDKDNYNSKGFNKHGYSKYGYDLNGYNRSGYDLNGYNIHGFNKDGWNNKGKNKYGRTKSQIDSCKKLHIIKAKKQYEYEKNIIYVNVFGTEFNGQERAKMWADDMNIKEKNKGRNMRLERLAGLGGISAKPKKIHKYEPWEMFIEEHDCYKFSK